MIPEKFHDIFEKGPVGHIGTLMPNGSIQITPVLVVKDSDVLKVSTTRSRQKCKNLTANPTVTVEVMDPENRFHYIEVRGKATITDDTNNAFVDSIAQRFMGKPRYDMDPPGEKRSSSRSFLNVFAACKNLSSVTFLVVPANYQK